MLVVNGTPLEFKQGMTVRDILTEMRYTFPLLVIKINGRLVRRDQYNDATVDDGAEIQVIHLMGGG